MRKNLNKLELLSEMYEMTEHNLFCYSENSLMTKPKNKFIKEWNREKEKLELLKEMIEEEKQTMKAKNINFTQKHRLKMYPNTIYYVRNSNGRFLAYSIELEEAKRYAEEYKTEYMKDKLNNKVGVYVFDKEGKNLYVAKGTKKGEIEEFE